MSKIPAPAFSSIETADLEIVTGGAAQRSSSRSVTDDRLMAKLESISTAIKDVASQQKNNGGNDAMSQLMPILAMKMMKR
jgi:hypothetical protein